MGGGGGSCGGGGGGGGVCVCVAWGGGVLRNFVETSWVPACRDSGSRTRCRLCYRLLVLFLS